MLGNGQVRFGGRGRGNHSVKSEHGGSPPTPTHGKPLGLDGVEMKFDAECLVSDSGVAHPATLAARLGSGSEGSPRVRDLP